MRLSCPALVLLLTALSCSSAFSQQPPPRDPQAVALAGRAFAALTGGMPVSDAILTGTAHRTAGSSQASGTITLKARGTQESRIELSLPSGRHTHIRNQAAGYSQGAWSGGDGASHPVSLHNCWTDAAWFFPPLATLAAISSADAALSYVGREERQGISVEHLRIWRQARTKTNLTADLIQRLSTVDLYLDSASLLPVAITFNVHPDDDAGIDIPVEVRYSDYRLVNGARIPFHIQKFIQGGLVLDITLNAASVNVGLQDADFGLS